VLTWWQSLEYLTAIGLDRTAQSLLGAIMIVPGACAAWRRSAVLTVGGFDGRTLAEDCDLTMSLQRARWRITQEHEAVAYTEVPQSPRSLVRQRFRWMFGSLQAVWKQRSMLLRPRYGVLGMVVMPYAVLSILVPLLFMPVAYGLVVQSIVIGDWQKVLVYLGLLTAFHFAVAAVAVVMMRERWWHLLVVPIYRLIYEPLRTYLLYATALAVLRGRTVGWNKLHRKGTVRLRTPVGGQVPAPVTVPAVVPVRRVAGRVDLLPEPVPDAVVRDNAPEPRAVVQLVRADIPASSSSTSRS
jgi:biofilm PGA synthesis N-glycosyltransferase PgaC